MNVNGCERCGCRHVLARIDWRLVLAHYFDRTVAPVTVHHCSGSVTSHFCTCTRASCSDGTMSQEQPYQDEVTIGEMELIEDDGVYVYECRCSGEYLLEIEDVDGDHPYYIVPCDSCSLAIKVTATQS
eukprot:m.7584 g.7584  ORF g.7584 m.7584 type:complete len:128 (-) comp5263_c0_seq2:5364-5747(-)